ncbi:unnamed protein product [Caenorhabditis bovis]|uniref:Apple domain-containing protein n=1 Tax=Caenorhabditis bovis TaxID=2654633 RepID=A0A8S1EGY1_9PELO|nr:unnamed protein product [Caenorhabditis bovis]
MTVSHCLILLLQITSILRQSHKMTLHTWCGLLFCGLLALNSVEATCSPSFFAKSIKYEEAVEIDFYYTGINLASAAACASFCAQREFCRSAVYNSRTKTCGISYEYTLACVSHVERYKEYEADSNNGDLIQIACVDECPKGSDKNNSSKNDKLDQEGPGKVPIGIITGEPNNGNRPQEDSETEKLPKPKAQGYVTRLVLANISGIPEGGVGVAEPLALPQSDGNVNNQKKNKGKSQICYRTIRHRYLLGGDFEQHDVSSINECRCLCAATYKDGKYKCHSFQYRAGTCTLNKGNHLGHYDLIEQRKTVYQYVDCDVEVLLAVAAKFCPNFKTLVKEDKSKSNKQEPEAAPGKKKENKKDEKKENKKNDKKADKKEEKKIDNKKAVDNKKTNKVSPKIKNVPKIAPKPKPTTAKPKPTTAKPKPTTPKSTTKSTPRPTPKKTERPVSKTEPTTTKAPEPKSKETGHDESVKEDTLIKRNDCFEVIDDHLMVSVAGGLEHDVSIEECQCICANSKKSGKYPFQCASATYYHIERDCILNLENRFMKSKLFEKQVVNFNVSYIGITCPTDKAVTSTADLAKTNCRRSVQETAPTPKKKKNGVNSDECYVELGDFVLEGTAIAVETGITAAECKCKCAQGEKLYVDDCASFLYYYDSKTCLINKQNRFSNPEKFNFVPSLNQSRSYFEWTCANKDAARHKYLSDVCSISQEIVEGNLLNSEGQTVEVKQDTPKLENNVVRTTRLDEKEFLERIEQVEGQIETTTTTEKITTTVAETTTTESETTTAATKNEETEVVVKEIEESLLKKIEEADGELEKKTSETGSNLEEVGTKTVDTNALLKKIEESDEKLSKVTATPPKATTTTEPDATTESANVEEKSSKADNSEIGTHPADQDVLLKKIEKADKELEKKSAEIDNDIKHVHNPNPNSNQTTVETHAVDEKELIKKIEDAENELSTDTTNPPVFVLTEPTPTTTAKLILNKKKSKTSKDKSTGNDKKLESKEIGLREMNEKTIEELINQTVQEKEDAVFDGEEENEEVDPKRVKMKKVEARILEKLSEIEEKSVIPVTSAERRNDKNTQTAVKSNIPQKKRHYLIPEAEGVDDENEDDATEELPAELDEPTTRKLPTTTTTATTTKKSKASGVKTHKFDEKIEKEMPPPLIRTTPEPTTTTPGYPPAGRCSYSALYQTAFFGRRLLKTVRVKSPADCFAACYALRCRSANLISQGDLNSCELYKDSLIDYRRPDMIGYDATTVYFDGINCDGGF